MLCLKTTECPKRNLSDYPLSGCYMLQAVLCDLDSIHLHPDLSSRSTDFSLAVTQVYCTIGRAGRLFVSRSVMCLR